MKHLLILTLLLTAWTANATRSRMESLGQDPLRGSFYIDDNRNIFRNTADINRFRNFTTFEIGANIGDEATPTEGVSGRGDAEGGYFSEVGDFAWGVYLGRRQAGTSGVVQEWAQAATNTELDQILPVINGTVDLYFGGDAGVEWGVNVRFGRTATEVSGTKTQNNTWAINAGVRTGDFGVYAGYGADKYEIDGDIEGGLFTVGATYALKDLTIWFQYDGGNIKSGDKKVGNMMNIDVGVGHIYEISPTARLNFDLSYRQRQVKGDDEVNTGADKLVLNGMPLVIGAEVDAASWLVVRGSVNASLFGVGGSKVEGDWKLYEDEDDTTGAGDASRSSDSSSVSAGVGLNFGKLKIDGNLGVSSNAGFQGLFDSTNMFGNAAVIYWF